MAKKKSKSQQQPPVVEAEVVGGSSLSNDAVVVDVVPEPSTNDNAVVVGGGEDEGEEMELLQVDLGDMVKMKQVLDEGVSSSLLDHVPEDYRWDNFKLLLMFVACAFAMTAQFAPIPFPESRPVLGICGSLYFFLSGILQFITTFVDKDMIMQSNPLDSTKDKNSNKNDKSKKLSGASSSAAINPLLYKYGLRVRSSLPRFSEFYTVILEFRIPSNDPMHSSVTEKSVKAVWSVGKFFDKEGYFDEVGLSEEVSKLYKKLEAQDYNGWKVEDSGKKKKE